MWSIHVVVMAGLIPRCPGPLNLLDRHWIWVVTKQHCTINFDGDLNDTPCCPVIVTSLGTCFTAMISATRDLQTQCHMVIETTKLTQELAVKLEQGETFVSGTQWQTEK